MLETYKCRHISEYQKLQRIGQGTYGVVFHAKQRSTQNYYAIKKMKVIDTQGGFPITSLRQVMILNKIKHPNIIHLKEVLIGNKSQLVFIVLQLCQIDLQKLIQQMSMQKLSFTLGQIKCILLQLLKGVGHLHQNYIIHRDLKLNNILINKFGIIKIADFGLARTYQSPYQPITRKVVTLWYRPPELILKIAQYGEKVDIWSIGCIMAELLNQGTPLMRGNNQVNQFQLMCQLLGYPTRQQWPQFYSDKYKQIRKQVQKFSIYRSNNLKNYLKDHSTNCYDLISNMLKWNPQNRIVIDDAIMHPFFYQSPKALFPDQLKILQKIAHYSKKNIQSINKKKP